jgi:hypothetical protein
MAPNLQRSQPSSIGSNKVACRHCGAANYLTDPVCLGCGNALTVPPSTSAANHLRSTPPLAARADETERQKQEEARLESILYGAFIAGVVALVVGLLINSTVRPGDQWVRTAAMIGVAVGAVKALLVLTRLSR